jgi:hypothetical protein
MEAVPATYEFLPAIFSCAISEDTQGTTDTGGSGEVYSFAGGTTSSPTLSSLTIEAGDAQRADEMEYSTVESFSIEGEGGGELNISANWFGRQATDAEFTSPLVLADEDAIMFSQGKLYIDAVSDTVGTTQVSDTLRAMNMSYTTGAVARYGANGQLYFESAAVGKPEAELTLTYEHNASAEAEIAAYRARTPRQLRLIWTGPALATAGTYAVKTFILDMAGMYTNLSSFEDRDGNDVVSMTFKPTYDPTAALFLEAVVVNEKAGI